ncbi:hypothetical protein GIB67_015480, partial [Kingdonia uniflora]
DFRHPTVSHYLGFESLEARLSLGIQNSTLVFKFAIGRPSVGRQRFGRPIVFFNKNLNRA